MSGFSTTRLPSAPTALAPDGSQVRILLGLSGGSMAHFELPQGQTARAVTHTTVEEIWYVLAGSGEIWRKHNDTEEIVHLHPGVCLTIPVGTHFQFRASATSVVSVIAITMPPWPGQGEAQFVAGPWQPSTFDQAQD